MNTENYKKILEEKKASLEKELASFAVQDPNMKGNWDAKVRKADDTDMEEKADEAQEYDNLLSVEYSLELKLKDVKAALEKIAAGSYGICEKCGKQIEPERLEVAPEAKTCMSCNK
ncbi:MAG TPA: TraR/DksA C4-type zinc finger protein [Chlamydiales bacterium]|nr:TraR/DksA C4-type zinc finger protein [Chlamydiales bacterium]